MANVTLRFKLTDHLPELPSVLESFQSVSVNEPEELVDVVVDDVVTGAVAGATEYMLSIGYTLDATNPASTLEEAARVELFSVDSLRESGGTDLTIGAVADGQHLVRSGTDLVGANLASPGGSNSQIQYNSGGAFAGASGVTTNGTNLSVGGNLTLTGRLDGITAGDLIIRAASNNPTGRGVIIQGGFADTTGGKVRLEGGSGGQVGGGIELIASEGTNGAGGSLLYVGGLGAANDGSGAGGGHTFTCGQGGFNSGDGGSFNVTTGLAEGSSAASGSIILDIGVSFGGGPQGNVFIAPSRGNVGIGGLTLDGSALLELTSTSKGFLMTRMTTTQRDAISSPATGLEIYNTTTNEPEFFNGSSWLTTVASGVSSVSGGDNINITGTASNPIVNLDSTIIGTGLGGQLDLTGADSATVAGGDVFVTGGNAGTVGGGGGVILKSGDAIGSGEDSGAVTLDAGTTVDGNVGDILMARANGSVGIGVSFVVASAVLEIDSTTHGFLPPRMTTTQRDAISTPATGLEIYNTTTNEPEFFNGSGWASSPPSVTAQIEALVRPGQVGHIDQAISSGLSADLSPTPGPALAMTLAWDGNTAFIGDNAARIRAYPLSTPWDVTTAGAEANQYAPGFSAGSVNISADGLELITHQNGGAVVRQATLTTAWDLSTATTTATVTPTGPISGNISDIEVSPDGHNIYLFSGVTGEIFQYRMGVPYDVTTMVLTPVATHTITQTNSVGAINFSNDGRIVYFQMSNNLHEYAVALPWQIATTDDAFTTSTIGTSATRGAAVKPDGTRLYQINFTDPENNFQQFDIGLVASSILTDAMASIGDQVGIGTTSPDASAILELTSTSRGFLQPRMTTTQRDAIGSPATGLEIYNTTTNTPEFFDGSAWSSIGVETLATTLVAGNTTGGNNIVMSSGDTIVSPDGATGQSGGQLRLQSGAGDGVGNGGDLNVIGGNAGATGIGGEVSAIAGAGGSTSGPGGSVTLAGGLASGAGDDGGFVILDGGNPGAGGVIGPVALQAGSGGSVGIGTFAPSTLLELQGTDPVLTVRADGDLQVASLDLLGSRDANSSTFAQIRAYNFRSGAAVEAASIDFAPATIGTSSGVIAFNTKTEAGSLTERVRIDDVGHVGIGTPTPDISAILELASSTAGFLQTRVTTTERDAIPSTATGLSVYNTVATAPEFFDGTQWVGYEASIATVYVRSVADLPAPSAGVITLANTTVYKFLNSVDIGTDRLVSGLDTGIVGIGSGIVTLSGTTAGALLSTNGTNPLCLVDLKLQQNGAGDLMNLTGEAFALNEFVNCRFGGGVTRLFTTGGMQIKGSLFVAAPIVVDSTGSVDIIVASDSGFDDDGAVDGVFVFEGGCSVTNFFIRDVGIFLFSAGSTGVRIEGGATITNLVFDQSALGAIDSGSIIFQVENPDDVLLGSIEKTTLQGAGTIFRCEPVSSSNFAAPTNDTGTLAFDGVNLITARQQSGGVNEIRLHTGVTSSIQTTIVAPDAELRGVTWARGNLITVDGTTIPGPPTVSIHAGFTTTVSSSFTAPATSPQGITYDGTNLISTDSVTGLVYVHDGISATILKTFATPTGSVRDIAFDGVNLIITNSSNTVFVMKGISATVQYSFTGPGSLTDGIAVTDVGVAIADDTLTGTIYVFDHSVTFDHSSATWAIINNSGATSSSDRGGSQYEDGNVSVTVVQNAWTDIADAGTAIFYAGFNGMEKCRLNDELNGEITWTGVRERGSALQAQVVITRAGGGGDEFYEVAVVINGEVQSDGKGSGVLPSANSFATVNTLPITRDLVVGDVIKVQIRNVTSTVSPQVSVNRLSIT